MAHPEELWYGGNTFFHHQFSECASVRRIPKVQWDDVRPRGVKYQIVLFEPPHDLADGWTIPFGIHIIIVNNGFFCAMAELVRSFDVLREEIHRIFHNIF